MERLKPKAYAKCMVCNRHVYFESNKLCHQVYDHTFCNKNGCQGEMKVFRMTPKEREEYVRTHE